MEMFDLTRDEQLLKARDVAKILNISIAKAYKLIQHGEIPAIRKKMAGYDQKI